MNLADLIAHAIKDADRKLFNEDYSEQARAVIAALGKEGYAIVPKQASEAMLEAGKDAIMSGRVKPENLAQIIYGAMVGAVGRKKRG